MPPTHSKEKSSLHWEMIFPFICSRLMDIWPQIRAAAGILVGYKAFTSNIGKKINKENLLISKSVIGFIEFEQLSLAATVLLLLHDTGFVSIAAIVHLLLLWRLICCCFQLLYMLSPRTVVVVVLGVFCCFSELYYNLICDLLLLLLVFCCYVFIMLLLSYLLL